MLALYSSINLLTVHNTSKETTFLCTTSCSQLPLHLHNMHSTTGSCEGITGIQELCQCCPPVPTLWCGHVPGFIKKHAAGLHLPIILCLNYRHPYNCVYPALCLFPPYTLPSLMPPDIPFHFSCEGISIMSDALSYSAQL